MCGVTPLCERVNPTRLEEEVAIIEQHLGPVVRRLASVEAIKTLKHRYWRCLDQGVGDESLRDSLGELFTDDALCDFGDYGVHEGREAIINFFKTAVYPAHSMMVHMGHNPEISVNEDETASGTWLYEAYHLTHGEDPIATWLAGFYMDKYAVDAGEWKIKYSTGTYHFVSNMNEAWARERFTKFPPE